MTIADFGYNQTLEGALSLDLSKGKKVTLHVFR